MHAHMREKQTERDRDRESSTGLSVTRKVSLRKSVVWMASEE